MTGSIKDKFTIGFIVALISVWTIVVTTILILPIGLWNTFVAEHLWNWFGATYFHLQNIPFWTMFGLLLLLNFMATCVTKGATKPTDKLAMKELGMWVLGWAVVSTCVLLGGYLVHYFAG